MSIDRVGGPAPPAPVGAAEGGRAVEQTAAATVDAPAAASPADQVRAGTLSVDGYVELRVSEATRHLEAVLSPGQLGEVREALRAEWMAEPRLRALAEAAIGRPLDEP